MFPIVDVFAGPGGLNEGFSQFQNKNGKFEFKTAGSFEMEDSAIATLVLRAIYHLLQRENKLTRDSLYYSFIRGELSWDDFISSEDIKDFHKIAEQHVHQVELGEATRETYTKIISQALGSQPKPWALVGGPPCQAYSLVGRARRTNDENFENDEKHFLYREYLHIIQQFEPPVFVMENVKGMLSATNSGNRMFDRILSDLKNPNGDSRVEYELHSFTVSGAPNTLSPQDFIIRAEEHGIPQRRHRVILLGVRKDLVKKYKIDMTKIPRLEPAQHSTVKEALGNLPMIRSGVSKADDSWELWQEIRQKAAKLHKIQLHQKAKLDRGAAFLQRKQSLPKSELQHWLYDKNLNGFIQHESRSHMPSDLERYLYISDAGRKSHKSPRLRDLPDQLLPKHKNVSVDQVPFNDRFKVQLEDSPSTTVVSHIAKDGHYYIHYDPEQMRSLTVREAARLQTFPDNYFFMGNRTQQYTQVGNAVPPLLAFKIAATVSSILNQIQD